MKKNVYLAAKYENKRNQGSKNSQYRKINVIGVYSYYLTIPKLMIDQLKWKKGQEVSVQVVKNGLRIIG